MKTRPVSFPKLRADMPKNECFRELSQIFSLIRMDGKQPIELSWPELLKTYREFDESGFRPEDNAGILTGSESGLLVVDVDFPDRFMKAVKEGILFIPDKALTIRTGSGKYHIYFQYPRNGLQYGQKQCKEYGFEVFGEGGVITAPGSIHPNTGEPYYVSIHGPIYPAPDWLLALYPETPTVYSALTTDFYNCLRQS